MIAYYIPLDTLLCLTFLKLFLFSRLHQYSKFMVLISLDAKGKTELLQPFKRTTKENSNRKPPKTGNYNYFVYYY